MDKKSRKYYLPEEKVAILKRHLVERVPVSDLCDQYGLHVTMLHRWQKALFEHGAAAFDQQKDRAGKRVSVSDDGGTHPRWSRNGGELFSRSGIRTMLVRTKSGASFSMEDPVTLFEGDYDNVAAWDVSPDGQSFVMIKRDPEASPDRFNFVLNWFAHFKDRSSPLVSQRPPHGSATTFNKHLFLATSIPQIPGLQNQLFTAAVFPGFLASTLGRIFRVRSPVCAMMQVAYCLVPTGLDRIDL